MKKQFKRIYIEITNTCNRSCAFCSKGEKVSKIMSLSEFEHIIKEVSPYTDYVYLHVKGEPLLHPQLKEILDLCKKYKKKVNITTNGTLLLKQLPVLLSTDVLYQLNISLHHFKDEKHYIEDIIKTTDQLLEHTSVFINYRFWTLENHQLTKDMKCMLTPILEHYSLDESYLLEKEKLNIKLRDHLFLSKGDLFEWPSLQHEIVSTTGTCRGTRDHLGILSDGTVIPCCLDGNGCVNLGNIYHCSFASILDSPRFWQIKESFKQHKVKEALCQRCSYRLRFDHHK